ncbi:hypothetical protein D3C87_916550 [compost metagenome]
MAAPLVISSWMSLARPVSVSAPVLSPAMVTTRPLGSVKLVCPPVPPMPSVPLGTVSRSVMGVPKAADSGSDTTKPAPM